MAANCYEVSFCAEKMSCSRKVVLVKHPCKILNTTKIVYFKIINFMACELYLNLKIF